ncbi:lipoxygenase [Obelidium mucronatum]|nr:lipoxygenase [Obelidium mucronatum]
MSRPGTASGENKESLTVEITTSPDNHGIVDLNMDLTIFHSETGGSRGAIIETTTTRLHKLAYNPTIIPVSKATVYTFHVTASETIQDHVYAIALNNAHTKEWQFESIVIKRSRDGEKAEGWYFPVLSWIVSGPRRLFFHGVATPHDSSLPAKIRELRSEDVLYWREKYTPGFKLDGLPVGLTAEVAKLVHDEKFSDIKQGDFDYHAKKGLAARGIVNLLSLGNQVFTSFAHVEKMLYIMEKKPAIAERWTQDAAFAAQVLSGVNPVQIRAVPRSGSFPLACLPTTTIEQISKVHYLEGKNVLEELKLGRFSYSDSEPLLGPFVDRINGDCAGIGEDESKHKYNGYMAAPSALFWHDAENGRFLPIAIRVVKDGDTFYPPAVEEIRESVLNQWTLAKMWYGLGDTNIHQLSTHLLRTHLVIETFDLAMVRQLSPHHPVFKILKHHFRSTMAINAAARERLIYVVMKIFSMGEASFDFLRHAYKLWNFMDSSPVKDLEKRGFSGIEEGGSSLDSPGQYPWAEDARDLYSVIQQYVKEYISIYYDSDASVASDPELQSWIKEANEFNGGDKGVPKEIKTRDSLQEILCILIWTTTAQHSSVNFSQYTYTSYAPNRPSKSHRPPLKSSKDEVDEKRVIESLPYIAEAARVSGIVATLSSYEPNEVYIGSRAYDLHGPSQKKEKAAFALFSANLKQYESRVNDRNSTLKGRKENPYIWLSPSKITNSIAI